MTRIAFTLSAVAALAFASSGPAFADHLVPNASHLFAHADCEKTLWPDEDGFCFNFGPVARPCALSSNTIAVNAAGVRSSLFDKCPLMELTGWQDAPRPQVPVIVYDPKDDIGHLPPVVKP